MRAEGYLFNYPPTVITASIQRGEVQKLRCPRGELSVLKVHILLVNFCLFALFFCFYYYRYYYYELQQEYLAGAFICAAVRTICLLQAILMIRKAPATSPQVFSFSFFFLDERGECNIETWTGESLLKGTYEMFS